MQNEDQTPKNPNEPLGVMTISAENSKAIDGQVGFMTISRQVMWRCMPEVRWAKIAHDNGDGTARSEVVLQQRYIDVGDSRGTEDWRAVPTVDLTREASGSR